MNCSNLYSPEPDVAGQAVFIAFLTHTSVFLVLALVITPIVELYIPIVRPEEEYQEAGEIELEAATEIRTSRENSESEASGVRSRLVYRCYCREAVQNAYTSQYIAGIAFVVTAFVKHKTISYYHLRVIYCLLAMNSVIGVASNLDRSSKLRSLLWLSRRQRTRQPKWKMIDFVYTINLAVFWAFSLYVFIKQDTNFSSCYKHNRIMIFATCLWFFWLSAMTLSSKKARPSAAVWLIFFLGVAGFVGFESWQIWVLTSTFRQRKSSGALPGMTDEKTFTFGQILVLFMIVPLVGDFTAAWMGIVLCSISPLKHHITSTKSYTP